MQDLFSLNYREQKEKNAPLAVRMRPTELEDFFGQDHLLAKGKFLERLIRSNTLTSLILYGPAGCGKTTLAKIIAKRSSCDFIALNAVTSGTKEIREAVTQAQDALAMYGRRTLVFIDEIHRFNKAQQDALLPFVEDGTILLIGATTQNPYFEVNAPLLSRSNVVELHALDEHALAKILTHALRDKENGLGNYSIDLDADAASYLIARCNADARVLLNALELAFLTTPKNAQGVIHITKEDAENSMGKRNLSYDKNSDEHYDTISAFIKSMRGSDPDAALYYLARMIYCGEDPKFIARRMVIFASEDVSNACPMALPVAVSTFKAVEIIGMPEAQINLAHCAAFLAVCEKSNASMSGYFEALNDIKRNPSAPIPKHLQDAHYKGASQLDRGTQYRYPHDYEGHYVAQQYLPDAFSDKTYYHFNTSGHEAHIKERFEKLKKKN